MNPPFDEGTTRTKLQQQEPAVVQIDPKWCAESILHIAAAGNC